ncbi:helix-turn-helix transcriptional regulator [Roseomonas sp. CCTCC AB2023176]|uniref:helix-turn-helix transcriptional regulator n=1 Tax=Roseomonas sp. CCTCC AB2023176 TaxID=3342640 RepID=UPI0035DE67EE
MAADGSLVPDDPASTFLHTLGTRLRTLRARRGVTRRDLSRRAEVSERYIAQIEAGHGNISVLLLRRVAGALGVGLADLVSDAPERTAERVLLESAVAALPDSDLPAVRALLAERFGRPAATGRAGRIALVGLRGAGKSTVGRLLAARLGSPFVELQREVEREAGAELSDVFERSGQEGFRRLERAALSRLVAGEGPMVLATGGGIVADAATYALLLDSCTTVWLRATPEEHMARVLAQGDTRPMRDHRDAMADLRAILSSREDLYARATITVETSGRTPETVVTELLSRLPPDGGRTSPP